MDENSREFLTGWAMIAIAVRSLGERAAGDATILVSAINKLNPQSERRNLDRPAYSAPEVDLRDLGAWAAAAVALADACAMELTETGQPE